MNTITIAGRKIGPGEPCYIIAEACDNHFGSMDRAFEMIKLARLAGADAIKFQHHLPDEEMLRDGVTMSSNFDEHLYDFLIRNALTLEQHAKIKQHCEEVGIQYLCTPFSFAAARELETLGVAAYKIGSGELTDTPTLEAIAQFKKPMLLSTGMSSWDEIDTTANLLKRLKAQFALFHCTSAYPTDPKDVHLSAIPEMKKRYDVVIGHSDHTADIATAIGAIGFGASLIEKHFTVDKRLAGPDQAVSIDAFELYNLVTSIRRIELAVGSANKSVHQSEAPIRSWARRSVVSIKTIAKGTRITADMVWTKRPGTGIPAVEMTSVIGCVANEEIPVNTLLSWEQLKNEPAA